MTFLKKAIGKQYRMIRLLDGGISITLWHIQVRQWWFGKWKSYDGKDHFYERRNAEIKLTELKKSNK